MKLLSLITCALIAASQLTLSSISFGQTEAFSATIQTSYGLIKDNAVLLSEDTLSPITSLPPTYFVIIDGETTQHYLVTYLDISGKVEKKYIEPFEDFEPKTKFASFNLTACNDNHNSNIRRSPTPNSELDGEIPMGDKALLYGTISGTPLNQQTSTVWYYVKYGSVHGYVYYSQGIADEFSANRIEPVSTLIPDDTSSPEPQSDNHWIYILMLCVPITVVMLALFTRNKQKGTAMYQ